MTHLTDIRVYYEDTDSGGVVYYANYLKFTERARTELLRAGGFENHSLKEEYEVLFVVKHIEADFLKSARLDNLLRIETEVIQLKNASLVMKQSIFCPKDVDNDKHIFTLNVTLVCINAKSYKPVAIPKALKINFRNHLDESL
ncbi:MAG: tol-pal system-associated acyl-CoA thioesterase [Alphaproteobacteria bacterium]|nr:tol-pal system-associated acyl-CoA thioesterase [Alphaproteobacteria bacterium]